MSAKTAQNPCKALIIMDELIAEERNPEVRKHLITYRKQMKAQRGNKAAEEKT